MAKKCIIIGSIIAVLLCIFLAYRYAQYILVWQANPNINAGGIKLMMTEEKVRSLLGKEEEYVPGFGGYMLKYQSKGIILAFLNDVDTDFYCKVDRIEITNEKYKIFNVRVGDDYAEALAAIQKQGFTGQKEGFSGYWKRNLYIIIEKNFDKVRSITIGVRDRVAGNRVY